MGTGNGDVNAMIVDYSNPNLNTTTNSTASGIWKRVEGDISADGWTGPQCPNSSYVTPGSGNCQPFCLYNLTADPTEHHDLAKEHRITTEQQSQQKEEEAQEFDGPSAIAADLQQRLTAAKKSGFSPDRGPEDPNSCVAAVQRWNGFWGPWVTPTN